MAGGGRSMWKYVAAVLGGVAAAVLAMFGIQRRREQKQVAESTARLASEHAQRERVEAEQDVAEAHREAAERLEREQREALEQVDSAVRGGLTGYLRDLNRRRRTSPPDEGDG